MCVLFNHYGFTGMFGAAGTAIKNLKSGQAKMMRQLIEGEDYFRSSPQLEFRRHAEEETTGSSSRPEGESEAPSSKKHPSRSHQEGNRKNLQKGTHPKGQRAIEGIVAPMLGQLRRLVQQKQCPRHQSLKQCQPMRHVNHHIHLLHPGCKLEEMNRPRMWMM